MFSSRMEAQRDKAAAAAKRLIRRDRQLAPGELKPLLAYIEEHFLDQGFRVAKMKRACKVGDNSVVTRFRRQLGLKPSQYVRERQLAVAKELLTTTRLEIGMIAELLGFSSPQFFARKFGKRYKAKPRAYRRDHASDRPETDVEELSSIELRQALDGRLDPDRTETLIRRLVAEHPKDFVLTEPAGASVTEPDASADRSGRFDPEEIWVQIRDLEPEHQAATIRERFGDAGRELFELLSTKSRIEGRRDRERGVQLAELALESVDSCATVFGKELPELKAIGWARLANARRLREDFIGAEDAIRQSDAQWDKSARRSYLTEAELFTIKAGLRSTQHRFEEAMNLASHAIVLIESIRLPDQRYSRLLATVLVLRASICNCQGHTDAAIGDFERAMEFIDPHDSRLLLAVRQNLAASYTFSGQYQLAEQLLPMADELCAVETEPIVRYQIIWLTGLVKKGLRDIGAAEEHFLEARSGFQELGERGFWAIVSLDLAVLYSEDHRPGIAALAEEVIPVLDVLRIRDEAILARKLLADAIARNSLSTEVLKEARLHVDYLVRDLGVRLSRIHE